MENGKKDISRRFTKILVDGVVEGLTAQNPETTNTHHTRAGRIRSQERAKQKAARKEKQRTKYPRLDPETIGKEAACHSKRCSCWMCGNPRKFSKDKLTLQEKRHATREEL
jgi:hypothetical protein